MMKIFVLAVLAAASSAYVVPKSSTFRPSTRLYENFGLSVGTDTYSSQVPEIGGEAEYKEWVNNVKDDNMLNRKVI